MMHFSVRRFREGDLGSILEIERLSFDSPYGKEVFRRVMTNPTIFLVGVADNGLVVAYILALAVRPEIHVLSVAVHPEWRRKGLGKTLLQEVIQEACRLGATRIVLEVDVENTGAQLLYTSLGFRSGGTLKHYYPNGHNAIFMVKELAPKTHL
ncbi:MAG: ribosomal protein S18-alanine N-acetyltransferase [Thermoprotei archaeon]